MHCCSHLGRGDPLGTPRSPCTAEGRHWSFPGWGSFWCSDCFAKWIFERRWNSGWHNLKKFSEIFGCSCFFLTQAQFESPAAQRASSWAPKHPPCLGPTRRCGSPPQLPLRWPLRRPMPGTPRLHPPGRAARGEHRGEPPQDVRGRGRHAWLPCMGKCIVTTIPNSIHQIFFLLLYVSTDTYNEHVSKQYSYLHILILHHPGNCQHI